MPKVYQNHRENQRERILEVAERLFIRDGIDAVSISDIARAARMTRATLYEYFPNKQEVAWAVFQKVVADFGHMMDESTPQLVGSGFQKIERLMLPFVDMLDTHFEHLRFIVEINSLYAREGNPAHMRELIEQARAGSYAFYARFIQEGIQDGSIRPDLDPNLVSASILNLTNALNSRFALLGNYVSEEYGQDVKAIYREVIRAFLRGIQLDPQNRSEPCD